MTGSPSPYRAGARRAATIAPAVVVFGASFGLVARAAGMGAVASVVMSATTFAGSAQFAAASVLSAAGSVGAAVTAAILLNARYVPIGISVASVIRGRPLHRLVEAQLVVDESWAFSAGTTYRFGAYTLRGGKTVKIHTGPGSNSTSDRYWRRSAYVWGNSKDSAKLRNPAGTTMDTCAYSGGGPFKLC